MTANQLQIAAWLPRSRANGPGLRSVVWVQGCPFRCPGCCNPDFLPFAGGQTVAAGEVAAWILAEADTEGVSFSGGEPFAQAGQLAEVAERVRAAGKGVLIFTGFRAATLQRSTNLSVHRLLAAADLLVAGPYQRESPSRHPLLASANQELVFLTDRYRAADFGPRRMEFRIGAAGAVTVTGLPVTVQPPHPNPPPPGGGKQELPSPCGRGAGGGGVFSTKPGDPMSFRDDLKLLFDARIAVVNVVTSEEARVLREVTELVKSRDWPEAEGLYTWDIADQFTCLKPARERFDDKREATPDTILRMLRDYAGGATFILKDFHQVWEAKRGTLRALRNLAASLPERSPRKNILITTPEHCLPPELKPGVPVLELAKPDARDMDALLERTVGATGALRSIKPALRAKLVEAALGLTSTQARRVFQKAVVASRTGQLDERCIDLITEEKRAIIRESGALELYPYVEQADRVGGVEALKTWLDQRRLAFARRQLHINLDDN